MIEEIEEPIILTLISIYIIYYFKKAVLNELWQNNNELEMPRKTKNTNRRDTAKWTIAFPPTTRSPNFQFLINMFLALHGTFSNWNHPHRTPSNQT